MGASATWLDGARACAGRTIPGEDHVKHVQIARLTPSRREFWRILFASALGVRFGSSRAGAIPPIIIRGGSISFDLAAGLELVESQTGPAARPWLYAPTGDDRVLNTATFTGAHGGNQQTNGVVTGNIRAIHIRENAQGGGAVQIQINPNPFTVESSVQLTPDPNPVPESPNNRTNAAFQLRHIRIQRTPGGGGTVNYTRVQTGCTLRLD